METVLYPIGDPWWLFPRCATFVPGQSVGDSDSASGDPGSVRPSAGVLRQEEFRSSEELWQAGLTTWVYILTRNPYLS